MWNILDNKFKKIRKGRVRQEEKRDQERKKRPDYLVSLQVVTGGHYDVDVVLEGPSRQILYREIKQQYGQFQFTPEITGTYQVLSLS